MNFTQKKTTFLMTSIMMFAIIATLHIPSSYATIEPMGCTTTAQALSLVWVRSDQQTAVLSSNSPVTNQFAFVDVGETLYVNATLSQPDLISGCNFFNGTLFVVTPDLVEHKLSMQIPTVSGGNPFHNQTGPYIVNPLDDDNACGPGVEATNNTKINSCGFYGLANGAPSEAIGGLSHSSPVGEDPANAFNALGVNFLSPWNATTLSNVTGIQDTPVNTPLDIVTIVADQNIAGNFTGNFTLGNSTNAFETGDCTEGAVNATTGIATLECQASGTYDIPVGDTCFDITINAPSPYAPSILTLFGADDAENECFKIRPPGWNATTLSNVTGTQGGSVSNPLDIVTIVADQNFLGNFTGNFTLGNGTDVFDSGDCTEGAVNATTGIATLECQASATIDEFDGETCFDVTVNAPSPYEPITDILFGSDDSENECFVVNPPEWNATTQANVTGTQDAPVSNPLDIVTIVADQNFLGNFTGNFTLGNGTDVFDSGDCTEGAVNATTGIATLECQASGIFANTVGETCFDVTINAPSPYKPSIFTLLGAEDSENECFSITPPGWNATTLSDATGTYSEPVVTPLDIVTIVADQNFLGNFTGNFTLGNSTDVFETGDCTEGAVNATTGIATLECQALGTYEDEQGDICFDVTVNAPSPYTPITDILFGSDDSENECFELRTDVPYDAYTMSNVTGIVGPTTNPGDWVFINGTDGLFGNFTGNATLTFNSTYAVATTDCSYVNGTEYPLHLECAVEDEFVEPGQYCWDITITEITGNYTPSVLNLFGIDDAENECFNVFEGLTPGFWKANAENWGAEAWYEDPEEDLFNDVFGTDVELRIAKGKSELDRGNSTDPTLYGALGARGGDENALARHCVAAKLNAENPDVTYPLNKTAVITQCGDALNLGNVTAINDLKDMLDEWNNFGANISQHWTKPLP